MGADSIACPGQCLNLGPGDVAVTDRRKGEVELGDHASRLEHRQHGANPVLPALVEGRITGRTGSGTPRSQYAARSRDRILV
jgi:hypothetical protein